MPTKDQDRARRAYEQVSLLWNAYIDARKAESKAKEDKTRKACEDYEIAVKALGSNILRSGLSAALADLMRRKDTAKEVRKHVAASGIPQLANVEEHNLFSRVNGLDAAGYMLATRETLQVVMWLKRACEALFDFKPDPAPAGGTAAGDGHAQ
jgi:CRISPR-associated protein Cmr5